MPPRILGSILVHPFFGVVDQGVVLRARVQPRVPCETPVPATSARMQGTRWDTMSYGEPQRYEMRYRLPCNGASGRIRTDDLPITSRVCATGLRRRPGSSLPRCDLPPAVRS